MFDTETIYEVVIFSIGDTKSGTKMGKLQLKDPSDDSLLNCILWEETLNRLDSKLFRSGNKLRIVSGSFNEKYNNCLVSALELIEEAKMGLDENEQNQVYSEIMSYIDKITEEKYQTFLKEYFNKHEAEIKIAPAAKLMHHNYMGGLMIHTLECLKYTDAIIEASFQRISKDRIYTACILHDIGKIFEYTIDKETGLIDYDEDFKKDWLSHSQYGFTICMEKGLKKIARMIAAHHGRADWGAIIDLNDRDVESDCYLIHHIDDLSAKFGKINVSML